MKPLTVTGGAILISAVLATPANAGPESWQCGEVIVTEWVEKDEGRPVGTRLPQSLHAVCVA